MAARKHSMAPKKKKMKDMSVDEFFGADFDSESESSSAKSFDSNSAQHKQTTMKTQKKVKLTANASSSTKPKKTKPPMTDSSKAGEKMTPKVKVNGNVKERKTKQKSVELNSGQRKADQKQSLASTLKSNDPEFYNFLKGQDQKLLENLEDLSDSEDDSSENDSENEEDRNRKPKKSSESDSEFEKELLNMSDSDDSDEDESTGIHQLPDKLEVASDESGDEEDESATTSKAKGGILLKRSVIDKWTNDMKTKPTQSLLKEIVSAFHAAVEEAGGTDDSSVSKYRVEGGDVFNSIVRLCLTQIVPALQTLLQLPALSELKQVMSDKHSAWKKYKVLVKSYVTDLLELLKQLSEAAMINAILKHVHKLIVFYATFPKLTKLFLKRMVNLWTTGEETTRILAFLCINKIVRLKQEALLEPCLKQMYLAYVSNSKFTSPTTLPLINFMQKALVEMFTIDQTVAYQYAFVYIRQLAIHLRNAISVKKKNTCQAVYNWQFIHCLGLWVQLLCTTYPSDVLQPLVYPLTQTIIGTIKLLPTARYYPLRFHCVKLLNQLSSKTGTFIPTVPFLLEVFEQTDFNKRHKAISLKPFNFAVILKFSKSQVHEKAFKDGLIDQLYEHLLESFNVHAHSIGFPELIIPSILQLKDFLKKCKIANYCKQIKQILDKIQEQSKFITEQRKRTNINLDDFQAVSQWESQLEDKGTSLRKFYTSWRKLRDRELQHEVANKEAISGAAIDIPTIERKKALKATPEERQDFAKLFENDSESDDETRFLLKEERPDKGGKKRKRAEDSDSDDYSDFDEDELEQLAQSASSGDEESDEDVEMDAETDSEGGDTEEKDSDDDDDEETEDSDMDESTKGHRQSEQKGHGKKTDPKLKNKTPITALKENGQDEDDLVEDFNLSDYD